MLLLLIEFDLALQSCGLRVHSCRIFSTLDLMGDLVGLCAHLFLRHLAVFFSLVVQGFLVTSATDRSCCCLKKTRSDDDPISDVNEIVRDETLMWKCGNLAVHIRIDNLNLY